MATYYSGYSNTYRLILELSETKLSDYISTNKTRVNYTLKCSCGSSYAQWNPGPGDFSISINGSVVKTLNNPSFWFPGTNTTITIASGYTDITHNSDGSKTVSFSASYKAESAAGYLPGNMSLSGNYALTTIPRATTISSVTSEVYVNGSNSISIALDRKSTNFTQNVTIKANDTYQTTITNSDVNVSYVIPVTWINAIGSNTSISGTVSVTTYNGSTQIGDTQTSTFTLKKATPSTITCTDSIECNGSNILRVGITRQNTAFLHTVNFVFGSYSQSFSSIEYLKEYAPPMTWINAIPNATSGKGTVTVTTYYGSISLGSNSKEFELVVPISVVPSISSFTSSVVNPSQMSSWGVYVQGYSQAKLTIGASGSYGSTISEWYFDGVSQSSNTKTTEAINQSGTVTFKAKVKDSRGRTSSEVPVSISVNEYSTPVLIKNLLKRCLSDETIDDEGTYVLANFTFLYSSCGGKNSISTKIYSREITAESWTDNGTLTSGVNKKISSFDISKPYAIKVVSTDGVGNEATYVDVIETSNAIIDILKGGNGMGLGMMASKADTLQIGFPHIEVDNGIFYINYTDKTTGKTVKSQIGSQNGSYMHYLTDAESGNYFDKKVTVDNGLIVTGHADVGSEKVNGSLEVDGVATINNILKANALKTTNVRLTNINTFYGDQELHCFAVSGSPVGATPSSALVLQMSWFDINSKENWDTQLGLGWLNGDNSKSALYYRSANGTSWNDWETALSTTNYKDLIDGFAVKDISSEFTKTSNVSSLGMLKVYKVGNIIELHAQGTSSSSHNGKYTDLFNIPSSYMPICDRNYGTVLGAGNSIGIANIDFTNKQVGITLSNITWWAFNISWTVS